MRQTTAKHAKSAILTTCGQRSPIPRELYIDTHSNQPTGVPRQTPRPHEPFQGGSVVPCERCRVLNRDRVPEVFYVEVCNLPSQASLD